MNIVKRYTQRLGTHCKKFIVLAITVIYGMTLWLVMDSL